MNLPVFKMSQATAFLFFSLIFTYTFINIYKINNLELIVRIPLILLTLILCILTLDKLKNYAIRVNQLKFFLPFFLLIIVYLIKADIGGMDLKDTFGILYLPFFISLAFCFSNFTWSRQQVRTLSLFSYIAIFALIIQTVLKSDILNTNILGSFAYFLSFFPLLYLAGYTKKNFKFIRLATILGLVLFLILSSNTRSALICVAVGIITWFLWRLISGYKIIFYGYFLITLIAGFIFTVVYPYLDKYIENFQYYNQLVYQYTGKTLFSGREALWRIMIETINEKPLFGHGSSVQLKDFLSVELSAHNLYLQVALQVGMVGLFILLFFYLNIWKAVWLNRHDIRVKLFACFFIGIITYQLFELSLLQNHIHLAIIQWMIIGLGLSFSFNKIKTPNKENTPS